MSLKSHSEAIVHAEHKIQTQYLECHNLYENMLGCRTSLSKEEIAETMKELLEEMQSDLNNRKSSDLLKKYTEDINSLSTENLQAFEQNKEKQFYSYFKLDNRTRYINTALNDNMTPSIYAYYFCDKSKHNLSDKDAATMKAITSDTNFEMNDDTGIAGKYYRNNKDDDQISNHSNSNSNLFNSSLNEKEVPHLKRKRKNSAKGMSASKRVNRKTNKLTHKQNPYEDNEDDNLRAVKKKEDCEEDDDNKEYCIHNCLMGRKYQEVDMIACDSCNNWFHPKCINMSNEEFKRFQLLSWNCDDCKE